MKQLDWQMVAFVGLSLLQDFFPYHHIPKVYYWDTNLQHKIKKENNKN